MSRPLLTIGIPHLDRTELLERAIKSCLAQTVPVHVIVADQGRNAETKDMLSRYPGVEHIYSEATTLWGNWECSARACDTEYFSFCQDDDILAPGYARRVIAAFEAFPQALHWQSRLQCTTHVNLAAWYLGNGPWLPMDMIGGRIDLWGGDVLVPSAYLTSWALSPAVAFRCGQEFNNALEAMPEDCAIFAERLILAEMGKRGPFVADPIVAGYWLQHDRNESRKQWGDQPRQTAGLVKHLDGLMDDMPPTWKDSLKAWAAMMPTHYVASWGIQAGTTRTEGGDSKYLTEIEGILVESLKGRIEVSAIEQPSQPRPKRWWVPRLPKIGFGREPLYDIAMRHGTDKEFYHHYSAPYEEAFGVIRDKPVMLLEIGVGGNDDPKAGGESLRMWRDYFRHGQIYGIDLHDKSAQDSRRIKTFRGSQDDPAFLLEVIQAIGHPDIIVDDGSHECPRTLASFEILWPSLKPGGWYVIEDTRTSYLEQYGGSRLKEDETTTMGWFKRLLDDLNGAEWAEQNHYAETVESIRFVLNMIFVRKTLALPTGHVAGRPKWQKV